MGIHMVFNPLFYMSTLSNSGRFVGAFVGVQSRALGVALRHNQFLMIRIRICVFHWLRCLMDGMTLNGLKMGYEVLDDFKDSKVGLIKALITVIDSGLGLGTAFITIYFIFENLDVNNRNDFCLMDFNFAGKESWIDCKLELGFEAYRVDEKAEGTARRRQRYGKLGSTSSHDPAT
ncbi:hypothetical protein Cgig2_032344 [Carnegiea gigantea]|uniref:Uncharacterized protein n=1 Tax=Carnegiea gigantea TaxID=171969 RepID=A0A9Q1GYY1_9CARY|nr:hypothetical protein Cgig2_032344 [Carnegiea gigantea]